MASEIKSDKLSPSTGTALQIGDASDTITIPTGATFTITDGLGVGGGGTGLTSFTAGDVLYATGTTTLAKLAKGTAEQILSMNSGATAPEWTTAAATAGGTGQTGFTAGDILYANSTTTLTKLAKGTGLQGLQTNSGATAPEWVNSPQSLMTAAGDILYASGANTLAKLAKGSDDEILTLASGVPSWAAAAGGGITEADSWRLTTSFTGNNDPIGANLERSDTTTAGQSGQLGTGMTESSGVFTFPSTGWWTVAFQGSFSMDGDSRYMSQQIFVTVNNSTYVQASSVDTWIYAHTSTTYANGYCMALIDVTDVANVKVRFGVGSEDTAITTVGSSVYDATSFKFIRLGDT